MSASRLAAEAQACGLPFSEFVRNVLIDHYEEAEDLRVAGSRLSNPEPPIRSSQLRKNLGLDS